MTNTQAPDELAEQRATLRERWNDLDPWARIVIVVGGILLLGYLALALRGGEPDVVVVGEDRERSTASPSSDQEPRWGHGGVPGHGDDHVHVHEHFVGDEGETGEIVDPIPHDDDLGTSDPDLIDAMMSDPERAARDYLLATYTWTHEQPERDRVEALRPLVTDQQWQIITGPMDAWDGLDDVRQGVQERATAELEWLTPELATEERWEFVAQVSVERENDMMTSRERHRLQLIVLPHADGSWRVDEVLAG